MSFATRSLNSARVKTSCSQTGNIRRRRSLRVAPVAIKQAERYRREGLADVFRRGAEEIEMAYWLVKSEPSAWSWDQQVAKGAKGEAWTGVRNFTARQNLVKMKKGDRAFFYHSGEGKDVVGVVEITREHHPDPTAEKGEPWVVVDVKAVAPMSTPVTLGAIKKEPKLKDMALVKYSRLSVGPVTDNEWKLVCKMGGMK
jgi:predicted RNA-binding protein with PUA-like domain